jgi:hypothetical protein
VSKTAIVFERDVLGEVDRGREIVPAPMTAQRTVTQPPVCGR